MSYYSYLLNEVYTWSNCKFCRVNNPFRKQNQPKKPRSIFPLNKRQRIKHFRKFMAKRRVNRAKDTDDKLEDPVSATSSTNIMEQYLLQPGECLITNTPFSLVNDPALKTSLKANRSGECTRQLKPKLPFPILTPPNSTDHNPTLELNSECAE